MIERHPTVLDRRQQLPITMFGKEVFVRLEPDAVFACELDGTVAGEQAMLGLFHHEPRERDRIANVGNERHRARHQTRTVHDAGVHLVACGVSEHRTAAGVEQREVLERDDCRLHGLECRPAFRQNRPAGVERRLKTVPVFFFEVRRHFRLQNRSRAAVNCQ